MSQLNSNSQVEEHLLKKKAVALDINAGTSGFDCSNLPGFTVTAVAAASGTYTISCADLGTISKLWEIRVISDTDTSVITSSISAGVLTISVDSDGDLSATHQDLVIEVTYESLVA